MADPLDGLMAILATGAGILLALWVVTRIILALANPVGAVRGPGPTPPPDATPTITKAVVDSPSFGTGAISFCTGNVSGSVTGLSSTPPAPGLDASPPNLSGMLGIDSWGRAVSRHPITGVWVPIAVPCDEPAPPSTVRALPDSSGRSPARLEVTTSDGMSYVVSSTLCGTPGVPDRNGDVFLPDNRPLHETITRALAGGVDMASGEAITVSGPVRATQPETLSEYDHRFVDPQLGGLANFRRPTDRRWMSGPRYNTLDDTTISSVLLRSRFYGRDIGPRERQTALYYLIGHYQEVGRESFTDRCSRLTDLGAALGGEIFLEFVRIVRRLPSNDRSQAIVDARAQAARVEAFLELQSREAERRALAAASAAYTRAAPTLLNTSVVTQDWTPASLPVVDHDHPDEHMPASTGRRLRRFVPLPEEGETDSVANNPSSQPNDGP